MQLCYQNIVDNAKFRRGKKIQRNTKTGFWIISVKLITQCHQGLWKRRAKEIFKRSIAKHNLVYSEYLGDGDTSSFTEVVNSEPYKEFDIIPKKLECIGHVNKRMGTRLRKLVQSYKNSGTPRGKGKLTKKNH